jgi:hypothetical protein
LQGGVPVLASCWWSWRRSIRALLLHLKASVSTSIGLENGGMLIQRTFASTGSMASILAHLTFMLRGSAPT